MTSETEVNVPDDDAPVRVATYSNPQDAESARAALASQGIEAVVDHDHGQYPTAASWVQLQVALRDLPLATTLLERGPLQATTDVADPDDMRTLRLQRRFTLARWLLYAGSLLLLMTGLFAPLCVVPFGLALWSKANPRRAFCVAFWLQLVVTLVTTASSGLLGLGSVVPLVAFYFAWTGALPDPPERLLASPLPDTPSISVGESWKVEPAQPQPLEQPVWVFRVAGLFLLLILAVWVVGRLVRGG